MSPLYEYLRLLVIGVVIGFPAGIGIAKAIDGEEGSVEATKPPGHMLLVPTDGWHPPMLYAPPPPAWSTATLQWAVDGLQNNTLQSDEMVK